MHKIAARSARYRVALRRSREGYSVCVPGLPGCWSQGVTQAEAIENIRIAIREYLEAARSLARGAVIRDIQVPV